MKSANEGKTEEGRTERNWKGKGKKKGKGKGKEEGRTTVFRQMQISVQAGIGSRKECSFL